MLSADELKAFRDLQAEVKALKKDHEELKMQLVNLCNLVGSRTRHLQVIGGTKQSIKKIAKPPITGKNGVPNETDHDTCECGHARQLHGAMRGCSHYMPERGIGTRGFGCGCKHFKSIVESK